MMFRDENAEFSPLVFFVVPYEAAVNGLLPFFLSL